MFTFKKSAFAKPLLKIPIYADHIKLVETNESNTFR